MISSASGIVAVVLALSPFVASYEIVNRGQALCAKVPITEEQVANYVLGGKFASTQSPSQPDYPKMRYPYTDGTKGWSIAVLTSQDHSIICPAIVRTMPEATQAIINWDGFYALKSAGGNWTRC
ncbi:hypothetical protein PYCC9005_002808 [Savitreella phatthalungensis]